MEMEEIRKQGEEWCGKTVFWYSKSLGINYGIVTNYDLTGMLQVELENKGIHKPIVWVSSIKIHKTRAGVLLAKLTFEYL